METKNTASRNTIEATPSMRPLMNWMSVTQANAPMSAARKYPDVLFPEHLLHLLSPPDLYSVYTVKVYHK